MTRVSIFSNDLAMNQSPSHLKLLLLGICFFSHSSEANSLDTCLTESLPIYAVEGRLLNGVVETCRTGDLMDRTKGVDAPKPGEIAMYDVGKTFNNVFLVLRGFPNQPYAINNNEPYRNIQTPYIPHDDLTWANAGATLPFVPTKIYVVGKTSEYTRYGYGDLVDLRVNDPNSYPLNSQSIIVSVDGYMFITPDAWLGYVNNYDHGAAPTYADVIYVQRDEDPMVLRRAFIPTYNVPDVAAEWHRVTHQYALLSDESPRAGSSQLIADAIMAIGIIGLLMNNDSPPTNSEDSCGWFCESEQIQRNLKRGQDH